MHTPGPQTAPFTQPAAPAIVTSIDKPPAIISMLWSAVTFVELDIVSDRHGNVLFYEYEVDGEGGQARVRDGFIGITNADAVAREMRRLQAAA